MTHSELKAAREGRSITRTEMGRAIGMKYRAYAKLEAGDQGISGPAKAATRLVFLLCDQGQREDALRGT